MNFNFEQSLQTIQSQYSSSINIVKLVESIEKFINSENDIRLFYNEIFNIYTAKGIGLDIWGRILGVGRYLIIDDDNQSFFGFLGSELENFNNMPFKYATITNTYRIEDDAYRTYLLLVKALANCSSVDFETLNSMLSIIFPERIQYAQPAGVMHIRFVFEYFLSPVERSILKQGLLTRAAGVGYTFLEIDKENIFGFYGSGFNNFNNGIFNNSVESTVE